MIKLISHLKYFIQATLITVLYLLDPRKKRTKKEKSVGKNFGKKGKKTPQATHCVVFDFELFFFYPEYDKSG